MINRHLIIIQVFQVQFYLKMVQYLFAYFGQIHPRIITESYGFEIFLENLVNFQKPKIKNKEGLLLSDYQKSDRDFAFLVKKIQKLKTNRCN